jgi:polyferredoxin
MAMPMGWFPELARFEDEKQRKDAHKKAYKTLHRCWYYWVALIVLIIVLQLGAELLAYVIAPYAPSFMSRKLIGIIGRGMSYSFAGLGAIWLVRSTITRSLRTQLNEAGLPTCMKCGYDLRGQVERRCPECGNPF